MGGGRRRYDEPSARTDPVDTGSVCHWMGRAAGQPSPGAAPAYEMGRFLRPRARRGWSFAIGHLQKQRQRQALAQPIQPGRVAAAARRWVDTGPVGRSNEGPAFYRSEIASDARFCSALSRICSPETLVLGSFLVTTLTPDFRGVRAGRCGIPGPPPSHAAAAEAERICRGSSEQTPTPLRDPGA